jgi:hypothetical protein
VDVLFAALAVADGAVVGGPQILPSTVADELEMQRSRSLIVPLLPFLRTVLQRQAADHGEPIRVEGGCQLL